MKTTKQLLALRLKELRKSRGLTQEKLAEMIGRDTKHISKLEIAGSYPSIETLERIAAALNVELKDIFNFDGFKDKNYIINEFEKLLKYSDENYLKTLYKIHKELIN
ncbi:helix-turn-helix transcriptional regulator [bacterium]|nr:helix-turn-helix transcriptional regulator [bacterium]